MPPTLIVLAAGLGSRFGGAKQVEPFGPDGETLLELNAHDAITVGIRRIVVVTRQSLVADLETRLARLPAGVACDFVIQEDEKRALEARARPRPWGTAHAVLAAGVPPGAAVVVNADDLYGRSALSIVVQSLSSATEFAAVLAAYRLENTLSAYGGVSRGVCRAADDGSLAGIDEITNLRTERGVIVGVDDSGRESTYSRATPVSMNLWGLRAEWWVLLEARFEQFLEKSAATPDAEFRLPDVVGAEVEAGVRVRVAETDARWVGVTHPADRDPVRQAVTELFSEGHYPSPLYDEVGP